MVDRTWLALAEGWLIGNEERGESGRGGVAAGFKGSGKGKGFILRSYRIV